MRKKDNDYSAFLVFIMFWIMIGALGQCESARHLDDIRRELNEIQYEISMLKYK